MVRRKPYSSVTKKNQIRASHVQGMGDVVFKGFQCLNPECRQFITIREDSITRDFCMTCPSCGYEIAFGNKTKFFDYSMDVKNEDGFVESVSDGEFTISHKKYIKEAQRYKYCIVCNTLKPIEFFDKHNSRNSGRQGECKLCKKAYNDIKNGTRLTDQHRESAQKRRLLLDVAGSPKIDSRKIEKRFNYECFNCGKDLSNVDEAREKPLDHTLPVYYLWPLTTETATLLCRDCNGSKSGTWPSQFYNDSKLKRLAVLTGIDYSVLAGPSQYNPVALRQLQNSSVVDNLLAKYSAYMDELCKLRNRILNDTGYDFFSVSETISIEWIRKADDMR